MIILGWSVSLFLILQVANVRGSLFTRCLPSKTCQSSLVIETRDEKNHDFNPLYLTGKSGIYKLAIPQSVKEEDKTTGEKKEDDANKVRVLFSNKEKVIYACPKTEKTNKNSKVSPALIQQDDIKLSDTKTANQSCTQKVEPMMKNLDESCRESSSSTEPEDKFLLYEIGYKVFTRHRSLLDLFNKLVRSKEIERHTWQPLYRICHHLKTRTTLYTIHTLYGGSAELKNPKFNGNFKDIDRILPLNENEPEKMVDTSSVPMDYIFQKDTVQKLFHEIFKNKKPEINYVNENNEYLARGHLVPDADMIFIPWKNATYIYANVVPMWQYINNSVWKQIEIKIRKVAKHTKKNYKIYTGVSDILSYRDTKIFLGGEDTKVMPIPIYLWKVIHYVNDKNGSEKENKAMAFIVINDPNVEREPLCSSTEGREDICKKYGWPPSISQIDDSEKIKTMFCCTYDKLFEKIKYAPNLNNPEPLKNPLLEDQANTEW